MKNGNLIALQVWELDTVSGGAIIPSVVQGTGLLVHAGISEADSIIDSTLGTTVPGFPSVSLNNSPNFL